MTYAIREARFIVPGPVIAIVETLDDAEAWFYKQQSGVISFDRLSCTDWASCKMQDGKTYFVRPVPIKPRYILIDKNSGYIYGDTADYAENSFIGEMTPLLACRLTDEFYNKFGRAYRYTSHLFPNETGYFVYEVKDTDGIPRDYDGLDKDMIESVEKCFLIAKVQTRSFDD